MSKANFNFNKTFLNTVTRGVRALDYGNPITEILIKKRWTVERAAKEIYKKNKKEFEIRGVAWTPQRFNLVKLGYDEAKWLSNITAEFFGIKESDIPRRDKRTKRARDKSGDPMIMSREARESLKTKKLKTK